MGAHSGGRPAATQDERQAQIDALGADEEVLGRFDKALYASHRLVEDALLAFAGKHLAA